MNQVKNSLLGLIFLASLSVFAQEAQEGESKVKIGTMTDPRDGQTYDIVTLDIVLVGDVTINRTWMAQNMNYETSDSYCYVNEPAYCEAYGRLYTFLAAKEACPEGWHVPTIGEWNLVFNSYGGIKTSGLALLKDGESGMNLQLGGFGDPGSVFKNIGISGNYWDAETKSDNTAGLISVQKGNNEVFHSVIGNWHRNSLRCIQDY